MARRKLSTDYAKRPLSLEIRAQWRCKMWEIILPDPVSATGMASVEIALNILENYNHVNTIKYSSSEELSDVVKHGAHYDELCINLTELNKHNDIGIIILSETWNLNNIYRYKINGFQIYYKEAKYSNFIITDVYRPNPTNVHDIINNLDVYLRSIPKCDISLLVGDMNIDLAQECEYNNLRYINTLQQNGYV
nr:unnamed protein product [Callosobruchus analis]